MVGAGSGRHRPSAWRSHRLRESVRPHGRGFADPHTHQRTLGHDREQLTGAQSSAPPSPTSDASSPSPYLLDASTAGSSVVERAIDVVVADPPADGRRTADGGESPPFSSGWKSPGPAISLRYCWSASAVDRVHRLQVSVRCARRTGDEFAPPPRTGTVACRERRQRVGLREATRPWSRGGRTAPG